MATSNESDKINSVVAKSDDGTIQITFSIPFSVIKKNEETALSELAESVDVPGFRKGKAPLEKAKEKIASNVLLEKTLSKILPDLLKDIIEKHKIKLVIYPKFELLKADPDNVWEVRATTCELPEIDLGDYKTKLKGALSAEAIWTPAKGASEKTKAVSTTEEKEVKIIKALLGNIKVKIPAVLLQEEVEARLSQLILKLEKLGLSLDSYLSSIKRTAVELRTEYEQKAREDISLELILSKVAVVENIKADETQIAKAVEAASTDPNLAKDFENPERKRQLEEILRRRQALNFLITLV